MLGEVTWIKRETRVMFFFQCSVVNFPLLTAALKEYASDSAIDLVEAAFILILIIAATIVTMTTQRE